MSTFDTSRQESDGTELDDRTERALTEYMSVLAEGGDVFTVVGENGGTYRVDSRRGRCTCPDHKHRSVTCKHQHRVAFATGERVVPAGVDVKGHLGEHVEGEVRYAATDGGVSTETSNTSAGDHERVPVSGGVLVYETRALGKELVGFESVTDWDQLGEAVVARGYSRGDVLHLPELDE